MEQSSLEGQPNNRGCAQDSDAYGSLDLHTPAYVTPDRSIMTLVTGDFLASSHGQKKALKRLNSYTPIINNSGG